MGRGDALGQTGLVGHVRAAPVDRGDDRFRDIHRHDGPAVARELDAQRQAHLAGADPYVGALERCEKSATLDTVEKIANAFGIRAGGLFEE